VDGILASFIFDAGAGGRGGGEEFSGDGEVAFGCCEVEGGLR
jgi:hypothetical protein